MLRGEERSFGALGDDRQRSDAPRIIQASRRISPGGGINGVAFELEKAFVDIGRSCARFVHTNDEPRRRHGLVGEKIELFAEVMSYTVAGTRRLKKMSESLQDSVVLSHCDVMYGDIYVNHGLHKAMLLSSPSPVRVLLRNPIHPFSYIREEIRHRSRIHQRIVCLSAHDKRQLIEAYPYVYGDSSDEVSVIPNGVDGQRFSLCDRARLNVRQECGFTDDDFVLLFAAWRFEKKGLRHLIEALSALPGHVKLMVAGGNSTLVRQYERICLSLGVAHRVVFLGARNDMPALHSGSDAYAMPTVFESWGLVGLEAMACGKPVLLPAVGGIPDYLVDGQNGLFINYDPRDIADKVRMLMNSPMKLQRMAEHGRMTAERFSWRNCARLYLDLIDQVWDEKRARN